MTAAWTIAPASPGVGLRVISQVGPAETWQAELATPTPPGGADPELMVVDLPVARAIRAFTSGWGLEFEPSTLPVDRPHVWEVTSGRSSNGALPWLAVEGDEVCVVITVHWSGNWRFTVTPGPARCRVAVGLHPDGQRLHLGPGDRLELPAVSLASGETVEAAAAALAGRLARQAPGPQAGLLTEWNHWWPYEDAEIDEATFLAEAEVAATLGLEVAVLDAGWFGRSEATSSWVAERGDWHRVNTARFPHGLTWLADQTRRRGIGFGIWIEAEAVGPGAGIARERPELLALGADETPLGYVCLGSPDGRQHVRSRVADLITTTQARWIKWDFNLDPGSGCRRDDHGHRADDGLLRHYLGLYRVLDDLRAAHPETIFEACSSGGLRIDAGLAAHVDAFFLSDPDWTEHHLACLWGAARMLPPRQLLHWSQSEWRGEHRFQKVDYSGTLITTDAFDTKIRAALLHRFGVSVRLTQMRPDLRRRLREHLRVYDTWIRPLLVDGILRPLTEQPLREERGCRQPSFQLTSNDRHLLAAFRLPPHQPWDPVVPRLPDVSADYEVTDLDGTETRRRIAAADLLRDGLTPAPTTTSALWSIRRC